MDIRIENRPALTVAFVRETGPYAESANRAWQRIMPWLESTDAVTADTLFLGVMHDDPERTPEDQLRYDAAVTLPLGFTPKADVQTQELAGGDYAVALHVGPYERMGEAWGRLMEWLCKSGRKPAMRACYEIYRNDPRSTPPEELRTEIYMPLEPK